MQMKACYENVSHLVKQMEYDDLKSTGDNTDSTTNFCPQKSENGWEKVYVLSLLGTSFHLGNQIFRSSFHIGFYKCDMIYLANLGNNKHITNWNILFGVFFVKYILQILACFTQFVITIRWYETDLLLNGFIIILASSFPREIDYCDEFISF